MKNLLFLFTFIFSFAFSQNSVAQTFIPSTSTLGMAKTGIGRAVANDAIEQNPAGMSSYRRYVIEVLYGYALDFNQNVFKGSIVDNQTSKTAFGISYRRFFETKSQLKTLTNFDNPTVGQHATLAMSYPLSRILSIGANSSYYDNGNHTEWTKLFYGDLGLIARILPTLTTGFSLYNAWTTAEERLFKRYIGFGVSVPTSEFALSGDMIITDFDTIKSSSQLRFGGEYVLNREYFFRAGYSFKNEKDHHLSIGFGVANETTSLDFSLYLTPNEKTTESVLQIGIASYFL